VSWARGVEWGLTRMVYTKDESNYLGRALSTDYYTLVVADMIDEGTIDANRINWGYTDEDGFDLVENYTIRQIEDGLKGNLT